jgi:DNA-binding transcriptional LysR family regulator
MLDLLNLDQLRVFVAIHDHGSFSAAARHLHRAQSAVSNAIANLEEALGVELFDRTGWKPLLTDHGRSLLADARAVLARVSQFKSRAQCLTHGLETELSIVFDVVYPMPRLVAVVAAFRQAFPGVCLRLCTDVLGGVPQRVLAAEYDLGVQGSLPDVSSELASHGLPAVMMVPTAAATHVLADERTISSDSLRQHTKILLTDHSGRTVGRAFSGLADRHILTADLGAKRAMLQAGLGWGYMPRSFVQDDLDARRLVELDVADRQLRTRRMPLFVVHRRDELLGPAATWLRDTLLGMDA